jgi:hypothetical protein
MKYVIILVLLMISSLSAQNFTNFRAEKIGISYAQHQASDNLSQQNFQRAISSRHSFWGNAKQVAFGLSLGTVLALPPAIINAVNTLGEGDVLSEKNFAPQTTLIVLTVTVYVVGNGVGVYAAAKGENPSLSFWKTMGYSVLGGGTGVLLASTLSSIQEPIPTVWKVVIALTPLMGAMTYTNFIADWESSTQSRSHGNVGGEYTHSNIIERSKLFQMNLLQIEF